MKVLLVQSGKRQCRSRLITSRRCAWVGKRWARPSYMVCPTSSSTAMAMVASQAIRCTVSLSIRPPRSSSPARSVVSLEFSTKAAIGTCTTTKKGLAVVAAAGRRADLLHEGVAATLVPRCPAVGGDLVGPSLNRGPGLCVGSVGSWTVTVRHWSLKRKNRRSCSDRGGESDSVSQRSRRQCRRGRRTEWSLAWPQSSRSVSGVATSATALTLSKEISPAHSDPMRSGMSQAFAPTCERARAVAVETP